MTNMYEVRLRKELELAQQLQKSPEMKSITQIYARLRGGNGAYISILDINNPVLCPYEYKVVYTFPVMYVGPGETRRNFKCAISFKLTESILMQPNSRMGVALEDGGFKPGEVPYNNHVIYGSICTGNAWEISRGFGMWYFIICIGCLLNQERFMIDEDHPHYNGEALYYWKNTRHMQPNCKINWPFDLNIRHSKGSQVTTPPSTIRFTVVQPQRPAIRFIKQ